MKLLVINLVLASLAAYSNAVAPLSVRGNKVLINGTVGMLQGNSLSWTNNGWEGGKFYNADVVNWLKTAWNSNIIRAALGVEFDGGYLIDPTSNKNRLLTVVEAAIEADIYVIIDWHSHYAPLHQSEAIYFFQEMARKYGLCNNVIYEIFNEPMIGFSWSEHVKPYAIAVIKAIRAIDPDNLIVVGTPNWSQDVDVTANDPITGFENIAYSVHFYVGTHGQELRDKVSVALKKNIAVFATEWGAVRVGGDYSVDTVEANRWISFLKQNSISCCNYCIADKAEGASTLKPGSSTRGNWTIDDLTESGKFVLRTLKS